MTTVQENIRQIREQLCLSQEEVAEKLGMSKNGYGKIERGQSDISLSRLEQIANIFNIDISEIFKNKEIALVIGENRDVVQNNYGTNDTELEKLNLIIQHQQEKIEDLKNIVAQKNDYITLLKKVSGVDIENLPNV